MPMVLEDLQRAFNGAITADPLTVLLPLALVALAQGLRANGIGDVLGKATSGLLWFGIAAFVLNGLFSEDRLDLGGWEDRSENAWIDFSQLQFLEAAGYWLLLLVAVAVISTIRTVVKR